jgi:DNA-binding CsgD family transcriptional regulator
MAVEAVAAALRAAERGVPGPVPPTSRVPLRTGGWLELHASWLQGPPGDDRISVVVQPARAPDTIPLLLAAHGLTPREAEVARLVLRGAPTAEIVGALYISPYTVQDHLKSVFDKVGVRSRRDLAARLMGAPAGSP